MIERTLFNADHEAFRDSFRRFIDFDGNVPGEPLQVLDRSFEGPGERHRFTGNDA